MFKSLKYSAILTMLLVPRLVMAAGVPEEGILDFAILRDGAEIGSHVIRFEKVGEPTVVQIEAKVDYRLAFIPLYLFEHTAREEWRNGRLVGMSVQTNDNGDDYRVAVTSAGDNLTLSINGDGTAIDPRTIPASLWNIAVVDQKTILDPADGDMMNVSVRESGEEVIEVRGKSVRAKLYVMTGDFKRNLWYDAHKVLVQVQFEGRDGSEIRYKLR